MKRFISVKPITLTIIFAFITLLAFTQYKFPPSVSHNTFQKTNNVFEIVEDEYTTDREILNLDYEINMRVRRMTQFDPDSAIFPTRNSIESTSGGNPDLLILPERPDTQPQQLINSFVDSPFHFLAHCDATSQFQIDTTQTPWMLQAIAFDGTPKNYGGDELYITYKDEMNTSESSTAVARIIDKADGRYEIYFLKSHSPQLKNEHLNVGHGKLSVKLIHTCGASHLDPPFKKAWKPTRGFEESGFIGTEYTLNVVQPIIGKLKVEPFQYPELSSYDVIVPYGDSVMNSFLGLSEGDGDMSYRRPNVLKTHKDFAPLNSDTLDENDRDTKHDKFITEISAYAEQMKDMGKREDHSAFYLGSCAWDVSAHNTKKSLGDNYHYYSFYNIEDHLEAVQSLIETLRKKYPKWKIYWQSCAAVHRQSATGRTAWGAWYSNNIRGRTLYMAQKELMSKLKIPVVDLYEVTYDVAELYDDHVHCGAICNLSFLDYFYPAQAKIQL